MGRLIDLTGKQFGEWTVLEHLGMGNWKCRCSCNTESVVRSTDLRSGKSVKCKKHPKKGIVGTVLGDWFIEEYLGHNYYKCICTSCKSVKNIRTDYLQKNRLQNCICKSKSKSKRDQLDNLSNKSFGYLHVDKYLGNKRYSCTCTNCNKSNVVVYRQKLIKGMTRSCGCASTELFKQTLLNKYGETNISKIKNPREPWQIEAVSSRENLANYIKSISEDKVNINTLCKNLGLNKTNMYIKIHDYNLEDKIDQTVSCSLKELELLEFVKSFGYDVRNNVKDIINPYELDIYVPKLSLAIEFNGIYWHSSIFKDKKYHQNKSIACAKKGIRLIHVFEYEWDDNKDKIKSLISRVMSNEHLNNKIYAKNTSISIIGVDTARNFCNLNHLQGYANSSINIGCYYNNKLVGIMTFGTPRFNSNYQYELIRLCWSGDVIVVGGTEKMFKYFTEKYNPKSIITYVDISKFTGESYLRLGFNYAKNCITEPNYIWTDGYKILSRYQTQKSKIATSDNVNDTEDTIMSNNGYLKLYNSGNLKLEYIIKEEQ